MTEHKEVSLTINEAQSVRFKKWATYFKNYFKQVPVPFKAYDFECNLKGVESYEGTYSKNIKIIFLAVLFTNLSVLMISLVSRLLFLEVKMLLSDLLKQFFRSMNTVKKVMKKHFNKNLIMTEEEEKRFQSSNTCWICENFIDDDNKKVRDHCHVTGKFRGGAYLSCNIFI